MSFREEMPEGCPPETAEEIAQTTVRYRLLAGEEPEQTDFDSFVKLNGEPIRGGRRTECEQSGLSLWREENQARRILESRANLRGKWTKVGELTIPPRQGKPNPMENNGHQTWWPSHEFDPVSHCRKMP